MDEQLYELFILKCAPIQAALDRELSKFDPGHSQSGPSVRDDPLIKAYLAEIALDDRIQAERMAEYYKIFYMLENYIRQFVSDILVEAKGEDWWETSVPDGIKESAKRSRERELNAGVTPRSVDMIEYITFGELSDIIKTNPTEFSGLFTSTKGLESVTSRLNTLRGPIMHCGVLAEDEVLRLKLSMRDWFKLFTQ